MDWRPIETAPKDATWRLLFGDGPGFEECCFVGCWEAGAWRQMPSFRGEIACPKFWIPLPPSPTS